MIKYHNAKDKLGNIIPIDDAQKGVHYYCLSCGKEMIPKKGHIREAHFCHKKEKGGPSTPTCSEETYLHNFAKHYIKTLFDSSKEFYVTLNQYTKCNQQSSCLYYKNFFNTTDCNPCELKAPQTFDLKQYYDTCNIEKEYRGYVADVMLSSTEYPERDPIFIEIAVSHPCKQEKLDSSIRIIEIFIPRDTDNLKELRITEGSHLLRPNEEPYEVKFHNFSRHNNDSKTLDLYDVYVYYKSIYNEDTAEIIPHSCSKFGRKLINPSRLFEIHFSYKNRNKWCSVTNSNDSTNRTCWFCKHHSYDNQEHEHICDTGRPVEQPTRAFHCVAFELDKNKADSTIKGVTYWFKRSFELDN